MIAVKVLTIAVPVCVIAVKVCVNALNNSNSAVAFIDVTIFNHDSCRYKSSNPSIFLISIAIVTIADSFREIFKSVKFSNFQIFQIRQIFKFSNLSNPSNLQILQIEFIYKSTHAQKGKFYKQHKKQMQLRAMHKIRKYLQKPMLLVCFLLKSKLQ